MPFVMIISGIVLIIAAVRNTQQDLYFLLAHDFTGPNNFIYWTLAILVIGSIGYIPRLKPVSDGFLILVILALFLTKKTGFFDMFQKQIASTQSANPVVASSGATQQAAGGGNQVAINTGGGVVFIPIVGGPTQPGGTPGYSTGFGGNFGSGFGGGELQGGAQGPTYIGL